MNKKRKRIAKDGFLENLGTFKRQFTHPNTYGFIDRIRQLPGASEGYQFRQALLRDGILDPKNPGIMNTLKNGIIAGINEYPKTAAGLALAALGAGGYGLYKMFKGDDKTKGVKNNEHSKKKIGVR